MNRHLNLTFLASYHAQFMETASQDDVQFTFRPSSSCLKNPDQALVLVQPQYGSEWSGSFEKSSLGYGIRGLYSTPDPKALCVVADGCAYVVAVEHPADYEFISLEPIQHVIAVPACPAIVFVSLTELAAWVGWGLCRVSSRASYDGIRNVEVNGTIVSGEGWNAPDDSWMTFRFDTLSGTLESSIDFPA